MTQSKLLQQPQAALAGIGTTPAAVAHTTHDTGTDAPYRVGP